jgi:hypothetical protein
MIISNVVRYFAALLWFTEPQGDIQGKVQRCKNQPVVGVKVCVQNIVGHTQCTATNRQGLFEFDQLPVGKYGVFVASDRWRTFRYRDVRVREQQVSTVTFDAQQMPVKESECWGL